jgi:UDP-N-acetylglucosamine 4,6-dehydratase/5-epimerase
MAGKTVLITGGSGFLGRHLARSLQSEFRVVLGARNAKLNMEAAHRTGCEVLPLDVTNIESVRDVFLESDPHIVIHAAATKFVDQAERQPLECVDVNVTGSQNVLRVALDRGVETLVGVSTDKAAPPVRNTYGLSKAMMERIFCGMDDKTESSVTCVRYGNVAWSTGSVLPIWDRMHGEKGVIGSTGPDMRRFFFGVEEAVALIRTAIENIDMVRGKVLGREMKAALIRDLLDVWIREKGGRWETIEGRPGERDDEFLVGELELAHTTEVTLDNATHYLISFNELADTPLRNAISSASVARLSDEEMVSLIEAAPREED